MKYETAEEKFERKLKYGKDEWELQPYNFQEGQPCPHGCIINKRVAPPLYYSLSGDCRAPSAKDCCMNLQFDKEYYETREIEKAKQTSK
jgi:hypothetical protein